MIRLIPLIALATIACAPIRAQTAAHAPASCGAEKVADLVGKRRGDAVAADARARSGTAAIRWIMPGQLVTMEYRADRLDLHVGPDGKIIAVSCG